MTGPRKKYLYRVTVTDNGGDETRTVNRLRARALVSA